MPSVTHTLKDPGQTAAEQARGTIRLVGSTTAERGGLLADDSERGGQVDVYFGADGVWKDRRTGLLPVLASNVAGGAGAAEIVSPEGTYYEVSIWLPGRDRAEIWNVQIPNSAGTLKLGDHIIGAPEDIAPVHTHQASGVNVDPIPGVDGDQLQEVLEELAANAAFRFTHEQLVAALVWTVQHNLGGFPNITVVDNGGEVLEPGIVYTSDDVITLTFSAAMVGKAYCS